MITLKDCLGFLGDLTEAEVLAVTEHGASPRDRRHRVCSIPSIEGPRQRENPRHDRRRHPARPAPRRPGEHVLTLLHVLHHFLKSHPEARPSQHPLEQQVLRFVAALNRGHQLLTTRRWLGGERGP